MITISKQETTKINNDEKNIFVEMRGLSTDTKPTTCGEEGKIENGSVFIEIDTGAIYFYDLENEEWKEA